MSKENNEIAVTLNINELLKAYNKDDFMRGIFAKAIADNKKFLVDALRDYVFAEITKGHCFEGIKKAVSDQISETLKGDTWKRQHAYDRTLGEAVKDAVDAHRPKITAHVASTINRDGFKDKVGRQIADVVEARVKSALGDVCENCGGEYY